ncbi:MAG: hypothetical protein LBU07_03075 [Coriobacteriales bacterium]|nr:hypothetical protein [Coriobacteriales bacterium]
MELSLPEKWRLRAGYAQMGNADKRLVETWACGYRRSVDPKFNLKDFDGPSQAGACFAFSICLAAAFVVLLLLIGGPLKGSSKVLAPVMILLFLGATFYFGAFIVSMFTDKQDSTIMAFGIHVMDLGYKVHHYYYTSCPQHQYSPDWDTYIKARLAAEAARGTVSGDSLPEIQSGL